MFYSNPSKSIITLSIALSCYRSTFLAAQPAAPPVPSASAKPIADPGPLRCASAMGGYFPTFGEAGPALKHGLEFCNQIAFGKYGPTEAYNGTQAQYEGRYSYEIKLGGSYECYTTMTAYTIDEQVCGRHMTEIINQCDIAPRGQPPSDPVRKFGGQVFDGCMIYQFYPYGREE